MNDHSTRILIWGAERLGDVIMTFPALKLIRTRFPHAHVTFATNDYASEIAKLSGVVDEVFEFKFKSRLGNFLRYRKLRKVVGQGEFDHIFIFGKASRYRKKIGPLEAATRSDMTKCHWAQAHANAVISALDMGDVKTPGPQIELPPSPENDAIFKTHGLDIHADRYIVFHPGSNRIMRRSNASRTPLKAWPLERFLELSAMLNAEYPDLRQVCVGTPKEHDWLAEILSKHTGHKPLNLCGTTGIRGLLHLLKRAEAIVCGDSGVMHAASVTNTPTIALFGPTEEDRSGAFGMDGRLYRLRAMPFAQAMTDQDCMSKISAQEVFDSVSTCQKNSTVIN